jgi:hypothetical protein
MDGRNTGSLHCRRPLESLRMSQEEQSEWEDNCIQEADILAVPSTLPLVQHEMMNGQLEGKRSPPLLVLVLVLLEEDKERVVSVSLP